MKRRVNVAIRMLKLSMIADRRAASIVLCILVMETAATALLAMSQRWLVADAGLGIPVGLGVAVAMGIAAQVALTAGNRIRSNLQLELEDRADFRLSQELMKLSMDIPTIEHMERREYLNRMKTLRSGTRKLASSAWIATDAASSVISLGLSLGLLATVHPLMMFLALFGVVPLLVTGRSRRAVRRVIDANAEDDRLEAELHDLCISPEAAKELWISGSVKRLSREADALWQLSARRELVARIRGTGFFLIGWCCYLSGFGAALLISVDLVVRGTRGIGDIVLVIVITNGLSRQIGAAVNNVTGLGEASHLTSHYLWFVGYAANKGARNSSVPQRLCDGIRLNSVSFSYPGSKVQQLRDITVELPAGSVVGLVGINGAGKSTLVKLLSGVYVPTEGSIEVDGFPLEDIDPRQWSAGTTGVFQDFVKFQTSLKDAIGVGSLSSINDLEVVTRAIGRAGAGAMIKELPEGLSTRLGRTFGGEDLSHGQWQKVAMARGFMRESPTLLMLDEPTAALDPQAEHEVFEQFAERARELTRERGGITILISHRFSTVRMADKIIVLHQGRVVEQGTHDDLIAQDGHYAELYELQASGYRED